MAEPSWVRQLSPTSCANTASRFAHAVAIGAVLAGALSSCRWRAVAGPAWPAAWPARFLGRRGQRSVGQRRLQASAGGDAGQAALLAHAEPEEGARVSRQGGPAGQQEQASRPGRVRPELPVLWYEARAGCDRDRRVHRGACGGAQVVEGADACAAEAEKLEEEKIKYVAAANTPDCTVSMEYRTPMMCAEFQSCWASVIRRHRLREVKDCRWPPRAKQHSQTLVR